MGSTSLSWVSHTSFLRSWYQPVYFLLEDLEAQKLGKFFKEREKSSIKTWAFVVPQNVLRTWRMSNKSGEKGTHFICFECLLSTPPSLCSIPANTH